MTRQMPRRRFLRDAGTGVVSVAAVALAGCSDPEDGGDDDDDGTGGDVYREGDSDPEAGDPAGGPSSG